MSQPFLSAPLLAVELDGGSNPDEWVKAVVALERAGVDLVTIPERLAPRRDSSQRSLLGSDELDSAQLAAFLSTQTTTVGLTASVNVTETEPFHLATILATLDYTSEGRAAVNICVGNDDEVRNFGLRPDISRNLVELWLEARDTVEVMRRLWDSWEDDAIIRDVATGRFIDRDRLHYVDFSGEWFSVKGPSIIPRPPQGQIPVTVEVTSEGLARWAAANADLAFLPGPEFAALNETITEARDPHHLPVRTFVDVPISTRFLGHMVNDSGARAEWLGTINSRLPAGAHGLRLRPENGINAGDALAEKLIPYLQHRIPISKPSSPAIPEGDGQPQRTLRSRLGLARPASRYAATHQESNQ